MSNWTSGYVAEIGYTYGYYKELNPLRVTLAFLNAGLVPPEFTSACELGIGQGVSANIHAAGSATKWCGNDFNPSQACFAQSLANQSNVGAKFYDDSFAEFFLREDLPNFDYIGLHGIWSWINDDNRGVIVEFIRKKLKPGGVVYISYNTQPGWAAFGPMRDLLVQHADIMGVQGEGITRRIDGALAFASRFLALNPTYARANPTVVERLNSLLTLNRNYLAHEYFNRDWKPINFATLAEHMSDAKLTYGCSAHYLDHIDQINMTADQRELLNETSDLVFKESLRDLVINTQFRRDYWVKGPIKLSQGQRKEALSRCNILLVVPRSGVLLKVKGSLGEADLLPSIYDPILDAISDHQPKLLGTIAAAVADKGVNFDQVTEAIMVLCGAGVLECIQDSAIVAQSKVGADRLNDALLAMAIDGVDAAVLCSPVTGGGVQVSRFEKLFLLAMRAGFGGSDGYGEFAWNILRSQGQSIVKEGNPLKGTEENLAELVALAEIFMHDKMPVLKSLQIV